MSISSSSFRLFTPTRLSSLSPLNPKIPIPQTLILSSSSSSNLSNLSKFSLFSSSISFQQLPIIKPSSSSSSSSTTTTDSNSNSSAQQPIEQLPPKLQEIVKLFQTVEEPKAKYEQLLFYGRNLTPLQSQFKTNENKVRGCVSQVWVRAYLDSDKNIRFEADSDSVLTKGLAALLVQGLSGQPVQEILKVSPGFVTSLGLQQSLTPSRNNGFLNMLRLMQSKALKLYMEGEDDGGNEAASKVVVEQQHVVEDSNSEMGTEDLSLNTSSENAAETESESTKLLAVELGSRGERIKQTLEKELNPVEMEVEDISYQHAGHAGVRGSSGGETHFNLRVVSEAFQGKSQVKRHRLIYELLKEELQNGLHALSIVAKTPSECNRG